MTRTHTWYRLTDFGQIAPGDELLLTRKGAELKPVSVKAEQILNGGTTREEIVYNRKLNHYFITSMIIDGSSNVVEVHYRRKTDTEPPSVLERKCLEWMLRGDTGISSQSMVAVACRIPYKTSFGMAAPHDPSDFGRCLRLVRQIPEIRNHFDRIGKRIPAFDGILKNWDELAALYDEEAPTRRAPKLYDRIQQLRGDRQ